MIEMNIRIMLLKLLSFRKADIPISQGCALENLDNPILDVTKWSFLTLHNRFLQNVFFLFM